MNGGDFLFNQEKRCQLSNSGSLPLCDLKGGTSKKSKDRDTSVSFLKASAKIAGNGICYYL